VPACRADLALAERLKRKDESAADELFRSLGGELYGYAYRMLDDPGLAEDALQEAMIGALTNIERYDGSTSLRTWLYGILRHKIYDILRKTGREVPVRTPDPESGGFQDGTWKDGVTVEPWDENAEMLDVVRSCIRSLPHSQREALLLRAVQGMTSQEAADVLQLSNANLRQVLHRARQAVRKCADTKLGRQES